MLDRYLVNNLAAMAAAFAQGRYLEIGTAGACVIVKRS